MIPAAIILASIIGIYARKVIHDKLWDGVVYALPVVVLVSLVGVVALFPIYIPFIVGFTLVDLIYHGSRQFNKEDSAKSFVRSLYSFLGGSSNAKNK